MNRLYGIVILIVMLGFSSCGVQDSSTKPAEDIQIDNDKVLFVELYINVSSESDDPNDFIGRWVDFPLYQYDPNTRVITGLIEFDVNSSRLILGDYEGLSGFSGRGAVSSLSNSDEYSLESNGSQITVMDSQGTVNWKKNRTKITLSDLSFHSKSYEVTLKVGESETREYKVSERVKGMGLIEHTVTETYVNNGFINKDDIHQ